MVAYNSVDEFEYEFVRIGFEVTGNMGIEVVEHLCSDIILAVGDELTEPFSHSLLRW